MLYIYIIMNNPLRPLFCRQGNKYLLRREINALIPPHKTYVELFAGSGAIFLSKDKAEKNVLNDLDSSVTKFYNTVKRITFDEKTQDPNLNSISAIKKWYKKNHQSKSGLNYLMAEKIRTCNGFNAVPIKNPNNVYQPHNPVGRINKGQFQKIKDKLKDVIISNADYEVAVKKYDSPSTFFFVDPPYEETRKSFDYAEDTDFNFERLNDVLTRIRGKFLMTINDSPRIRKLFGHFHIKPVKVYTAWGNAAPKNPNQPKREKAYRNELFIMNYNPTGLKGGKAPLKQWAEEARMKRDEDAEQDRTEDEREGEIRRLMNEMEDDEENNEPINEQDMNEINELMNFFNNDGFSDNDSDTDPNEIVLQGRGLFIERRFL